ncbi:hypothetical protein [Microbacterium sp. Bi128]|uniref:hypothetical protein n=1 Tax=Microbacterium sp. Bi128 TaxID=2821115 RepID=UPI001DC901C3|nr:hypothetical protein [Microbacterium sp. Bi128]CAH0296190.1 hypothetical protein SRABI128_04034 [Microbacterium sp. Bi128]
MSFTSGVSGAAAAGATAVATLAAPTSTTTQVAHRRLWTDTVADHPVGSTDVTVPTGSRAVGTLVTLDPSGVLRRSAPTISSGVTSAFAEREKNNHLTVTYVDASGMHRRMWTDTVSTGVTSAFAEVDKSNSTTVTRVNGAVLRGTV